MRKRILILVLVTVAAAIAVSEEARAGVTQTYVVDTTSDAVLSACTGADNDCSLRGAITNANLAGTPGDVINFDAADFPAPPSAPGVIPIASALPSLNSAAGSDTIDATGRGVMVDAVNMEPGQAAFNCINIESSLYVIKGLQLTDCAIGILILNSSNTIGPDNVIFDNNLGIAVSGDTNTMKGNKVGTTTDGSAVNPEGGNNGGIQAAGDNNVIGGATAGDRNVISGNTTGIQISSASSGNTVKGNYIGTDAAGVADLGNTNHGIFMQGNSNCIGGTIVATVCTTGAGTSNVISGNNGDGIRISGGLAIGNSIRGNFVGTTAAGTAARPNAGSGVRLDTGTTSNNIGGTAAGAGNLLSGNGGAGISIVNTTTSSNVILGNLIGTDVNGTTPVPNTSHGITTSGPSNTIGGTTAAARNVISGNGGAGVEINGGATGNHVEANFIGLQANGVDALGNGSDGVRIVNNSSNNRIGHLTAGNGNRIAYNGGDGVFIESGTGSQVLSNEIFANTGLGIDLGPNGVTPNDTDDADHGANDLQNFPVLTSVTSAGATTTIQGTLNSTPNTEFFIQFFDSASCDPSGNGEGEHLLGAGGGANVTDAGGDVTISATFPQAVASLRYITAVASLDGPPTHASEFSNCVQVPAIIVNSAADPGTGVCDLAECTLREAITAANADANTDLIHFAIGSGPKTINPTSALPVVMGAVTIDATTQPGFAGTPIIEISGAVAGSSSGLVITAGNSTVRGLVVNRFADAGIKLLTNGGNHIQGNYIGTDMSGVVGLGNNVGVWIEGTANNIVGPAAAGSFPAERNVISGNSSTGVFIASGGATNNTVRGNYIGSNAAGTSAIGNGNAGISIFSSAAANIIGGSIAGEGNVISGNGSHGVDLASGASGNGVIGNYIGTNAAGTGPLGNGLNGVVISGGATNNFIGGAGGERNIISANGTGVRIAGATTGNVVIGNFIGTDVSGTGDLGNGKGVQLDSGANGNSIGWTAAGEGNVISGNGTSGVHLLSGGSGNDIVGNYIGTDASGATDLGNTGSGVVIEGPNNCIGAVTVDSDCVSMLGSGNVISGNGASGVEISGASASGNEVVKNYIGTNAAGTADLGNALDGVSIGGGGSAVWGNVLSGNDGFGVLVSLSDGNAVFSNRVGTTASGLDALPNASHGVVIVGDNNVIGGAASPLENIIAFNPGFGVQVLAGAGNNIVRNSIHSNGLLGIGLENDGVTANDFGDPDGGPNSLQNFPVLTSVTLLPPNISIQGMLNSTPNTTHMVAFYYSPTCDASGHGEGETFIGFSNLMTNVMGNISFGVGFSGTIPTGRFVTATATDPSGNTSEFSNCVPSLNDTDDDDDGYTDANEALIGTSASDPCGNDGWPSELVSDGLSANELDIQDLVSFIAPLRRLDTSPPPPSTTNYLARWDLAPGANPPFANYINIIDITTLLNGPAGSPAYPPMFAGLRAFGRVCPFTP